MLNSTAYTTLRVNYPYKNNYEGLSPQALKTAYRIGDTYTGRGVTIGIITAFVYSSLENDLKVFSDTFGLPTADIEVVISGGEKRQSVIWEQESVLDTQWCHAIAPSAKLLVVTPQSTAIDALMNAASEAVARGADVVSMSFGVAEESGIEDFENMFHENAVYIASAGDSPGKCVYPSSSPKCLGVGGTSLEISPTGTRLTAETAWQEGGGGPSEIFSIPSYQNIFRPIPFMSSGMRATPDTSFLADPEEGVSIYYTSISTGEGGWLTIGGTSLGTPVWSGIAAQCIEASNGSIQGYSDFLPFLYRIAGYSGYNTRQRNFYDVIEGGNVRYRAGVGYDFCTGLGSPFASQIISNIRR